MELLNSPVTDQEVDNIICRLASLPDPSGTNKDAAVLLERLSCEIVDLRERASGWSWADQEWLDHYSTT